MSEASDEALLPGPKDTPEEDAKENKKKVGRETLIVASCCS